MLRRIDNEAAARDSLTSFKNSGRLEEALDAVKADLRAGTDRSFQHYEVMIPEISDLSSEVSDGWTERLAVILNKTTSLTERIVTPEQALGADVDAWRAFDQLLARDPDNSEWSVQLAPCDNNIVLLYAQTGNFHAAQKPYAAAQTSLRKLAEADSTDFSTVKFWYHDQTADWIPSPRVDRLGLGQSGVLPADLRPVRGPAWAFCKPAHFLGTGRRYCHSYTLRVNGDMPPTWKNAD